MTNILRLAFLLFACPAVAHAGSITDIDFGSFLSQQAPYDDCGQNAKVKTSSVLYHDFDLDGVQEAMVTASSCFTGTAGPDIHVVLKLTESGDVVELPIEDPPKEIYSGLKGNRNYRLSQEDGLLVWNFTDDTDQAAPLTLFFKWDGSKFVHVRTRTEDSAQQIAPLGR